MQGPDFPGCRGDSAGWNWDQVGPNPFAERPRENPGLASAAPCARRRLDYRAKDRRPARSCRQCPPSSEARNLGPQRPAPSTFPQSPGSAKRRQKKRLSFSRSFVSIISSNALRSRTETSAFPTSLMRWREPTAIVQRPYAGKGEKQCLAEVISVRWRNRASCRWRNHSSQ